MTKWGVFSRKTLAWFAAMLTVLLVVPALVEGMFMVGGGELGIPFAYTGWESLDPVLGEGEGYFEPLTLAIDVVCIYVAGLGASAVHTRIRERRLSRME